MNKPKIVAYLKPSCGWSQGVRAIMRKYDLPFEDRDIINDPAQRQEMIEKSGQMLSPCVEIDGRMLPDISGEEVEAFLLSNNLCNLRIAPLTLQPISPVPTRCRRQLRSSSGTKKKPIPTENAKVKTFAFFFSYAPWMAALVSGRALVADWAFRSRASGLRWRRLARRNLGV